MDRSTLIRIQTLALTLVTAFGGITISPTMLAAWVVEDGPVWFAWPFLRGGGGLNAIEHVLEMAHLHGHPALTVLISMTHLDDTPTIFIGVTEGPNLAGWCYPLKPNECCHALCEPLPMDRWRAATDREMDTLFRGALNKQPDGIPPTNVFSAN